MRVFKSLSVVAAINAQLLPTGLLQCSSNGVGETDPKIVGGTTISEHSWWWLAKLHVNGGFACGGTILSENWVLTAAHCCAKANGYSVVIGAHNIDEDDNTYQISKRIKHPSYGSVNGINNDFCLLKTAQPIDLSGIEGAGIACLPEDGQHVAAGTENCFIGGWGTISSGGSLPTFARSVGVNIYSEAQCRSQSSYKENEIDYNTEFCAGDFAGGIDTCQGDSGGPLICVVDDIPVLYGVVSWGEGCAFEDYPGLYAKVSDAMPWILETTNGDDGTDGTTAEPETMTTSSYDDFNSTDSVDTRTTAEPDTMTTTRFDDFNSTDYEDTRTTVMTTSNPDNFNTTDYDDYSTDVFNSTTDSYTTTDEITSTTTTTTSYPDTTSTTTSTTTTTTTTMTSTSMDANCPSSYPVNEQICPDFDECLATEFPGIVEKGAGLTDGNNKGSNTQIKCGNDFFNGNDGRSSTFKVTCGCNSSKGCRWVWKDDKVRQCLPQDQCVGLDSVVWGGFVGNRIVGRNGVHLNTRFYHESTADGTVADYSAGWTVFLMVDRQVTSSIGNFSLSTTSLEADFVGAHQESDCSSTVFQLQSNDFHGHESFTNKQINKEKYHELKIDLRFLDMWQLGDNVTPDTVREYFDGAKLGWIEGHHEDLTWCVAEHFSERPPSGTRITQEYSEENASCKP